MTTVAERSRHYGSVDSLAWPDRALMLKAVEGTLTADERSRFERDCATVGVELLD